MKKTIISLLSIVSMILVGCNATTETDYSISLTKNTLTLNVGDIETISASITPDDIENPSFVWTSENNTIASVVQGTITALKKGTTNISVFLDLNHNAVLDSGEPFDKCTLTVTEPQSEIIPVSSVTLDSTSLTLEISAERSLLATVLPANASTKHVTWQSSNAAIATINNGLVKALANGTATITAYVDENQNEALDQDEKRATATITVEKKESPSEPLDEPIPARGENLPIGNVSVAGPSNLTPIDISEWTEFDLFDSLPNHWSFIWGNNKFATSNDFYAPSSGGGFKFSKVYNGLQTPLLTSWIKTEVRLTVSQVNGNSQSQKQQEGKPVFHIYAYDAAGYYLGMETYDQPGKFADVQQITFYIRNPEMAYFEIRFNAFPYKGSQCYNFGVSKISIKGWPYL